VRDQRAIITSSAGTRRAGKAAAAERKLPMPRHGPDGAGGGKGRGSSRRGARGEGGARWGPP
jgi:hypothetical protein